MSEEAVRRSTPKVPDMTTSPWRIPYSSACKLSVCNHSVSADDSTSHFADYC